MKTGQTRIDDSIKYLKSNGFDSLANHLLATLPTHLREAVGRELSLGWRLDPRKSETDRRHAIRALLLCQRVYFSDLWAEAIPGTKCNLLAADWKTTSLEHWSSQSEHAIKEGIRTFAVTSNQAGDLAKVANGRPLAKNPPDFTLIRTMSVFPGLVSCYGSVITWMFKSGLASYRWFLKHFGAFDTSSLRAAFGPAKQVLWKGNTPFGATDTLPQVLRGHIVHLYVDNPQRWLGHWLVSNGDGTACGCNNDTENGAVQNSYDNHCSLDAQFLYGYKHKLEPKGGKGKEFEDDQPKTVVDLGYEKGVAEVFDPLQIPAVL